MNGNVENIHVYVVGWVILALVAVLSMVKQLFFSTFLFYMVSGFGLYLFWLWGIGVYHTRSHLNKSAFYLGVFGIGMFLFSYAMVPMYHLVCHAASAVTQEVLPQQVELDLITRSYRQLPVVAKLDTMRMLLSPQGSQIAYIEMYNSSDKALDVNLNLVTQPRALANQFEVVLPKSIQMEAHQRMRLPIQIKFLGFTEPLTQASIMLLLQDKQDEGALGKTEAWQKMTMKNRSSR
ncbi:hypothetical protein OAT84_03800 [Gammaproteobacteria bacterium]|nr:hypothetical protein [Gammaproteobacteria bacterium]